MLSKEDLELKELFFNIKNRNDLANVLDIKLSTLTYLINDKRKNSLYKTLIFPKEITQTVLLMLLKNLLRQF